MTPRDIDRFRKWLAQNGAEILVSTNRYELLRFRARGVVSVVYRNAAGRVSACTGYAEEAIRAWRSGSRWRAGPPKNRRPVRVRSVVVRTLLERDGDACFYCGHPLGDDFTIEHVLARAFGGRNHLANLALAHHACNQRAENLPIAAKVRLRDELRGHS